MKNKITFQLLALSLFSFLLLIPTGCSDSKSSTTASNDVLLQGNWKLLAARITSPASVDFSALVTLPATTDPSYATVLGIKNVSKTITDLYDFIRIASSCALDNIIKFNTDGTAVENTGATACGATPSCGATGLVTVPAETANTDKRATDGGFSFLQTGSFSKYSLNSDKTAINFVSSLSSSFTGTWTITSISSTTLVISTTFTTAVPNASFCPTSVPANFTVTATWSKQ